MVSTQSPNELTAKDLANIPREEIKEIQNRRDKLAIATFDTALAEARITRYDYDYLIEAFKDGMGWSRLIYRSIYETFGKPLYTTGFNPITGEVDRDENGKTINYSLKALTPLAPTRLKFTDKKNNALYCIFPKMKSADRTIEKLETELHREYNEEMLTALDQSWEDEDREAFAERLQNISPAYTKLRDIYRLTFTAKYLSDVKRLKRVFTEFGKKNQNKFYYIIDNETRDRFDKPLSENENQYYDIKMIMYQRLPDRDSNEIPDNRYFAVEIQLKIDTLFRGDLKTHEPYEKIREIEGKMTSSTPSEERKLNEQLIKYYNKRRKLINQHAVHEYNMVVLDKIYRIEDDYIAMEVEPDDKKNGTYKQCVDFITDNYMVESYRPFDAENAFSANNELNKMYFLKLIGKLPKSFDEFAEGASETINREFSRLQHMDRRKFAGINNIAQRYQSVIQDVINQRKRDDIRKTKKIKQKNNATSDITTNKNISKSAPEEPIKTNSPQVKHDNFSNFDYKYQIKKERPGRYNDGRGSVSIECFSDDSNNVLITQSNCVINNQQIVKIYEYLQQHPDIESTCVTKNSSENYEGADNEFNIHFSYKDGKNVTVNMTDLPKAKNPELMKSLTAISGSLINCKEKT